MRILTALLVSSSFTLPKASDSVRGKSFLIFTLGRENIVNFSNTLVVIISQFSIFILQFLKIFFPCKQCLCAHKAQNTHSIENLPCVFCLLGCIPNPCEHHGSVMAVHSCGVLKERFAKTRSPASARCRTMGLGCAQQVLATQVVFVYTKTLLARQLRCSRMVPRSTACKSDCASPNCQFRLQLLCWIYQNFFRRLLP